jgi:hypothetical protein
VNLHEWITLRVEQVEAEHRSVVLIPQGGGRPITGAITEVLPVDGGIELTVTPGKPATAAVLRRCEADRRILARHKLPEPGDWTYPGCAGCGTTGEFDDIVTDNINDCPELLDLAHAHGITPEELAALDRIERVGVVPVVPFPRMAVTPAMTTDQIPAALRGARWRRHHH